MNVVRRTTRIRLWMSICQSRTSGYGRSLRRLPSSLTRHRKSRVWFSYIFPPIALAAIVDSSTATYQQIFSTHQSTGTCCQCTVHYWIHQGYTSSHLGTIGFIVATWECPSRERFFMLSLCIGKMHLMIHLLFS